MTESDFTAKVLRCLVADDENAEKASMAMKLDLPIMKGLSIEDILEIRTNYGEAFKNFRNDLNSKLTELEGIESPQLIERRIREIEREISENRIQDIERENRKLKKILGLDIVSTIGMLAANYSMGGLTSIGVAAAIVNGVKDIAKYKTEIKDHNGFFLWKLKARADKYSV